MYLEEIIGEHKLENEGLECKSTLNRENTLGWLKTIAGFANADGGVFYIGVEDKTNKLIGFERKDADNERNYFNKGNDNLVIVQMKDGRTIPMYLDEGKKSKQKLYVFQNINKQF